MHFCHMENFAYGEINEQSFSKPDPCSWANPSASETGNNRIKEWNSLIHVFLKQLQSLLEI